MKYKIPVWWSEYGEYEVEANSLKEAIELVENGSCLCGGLPSGDYIDDSLQIEVDVLREYYPEEYND